MRFVAGVASALFACVACIGAIATSHAADAERKPADVMSWRAADWLTRNTRVEEEHPDEMLTALKIRPGDVVADIGAGVGYHVPRLSHLVGPTGRVIAEDIQPEMIDMLQKNVAKRGLANVQTTLGKEDDPLLPEVAVDLILLVDVYHEFANPRAMLRKFRKALKPNGRVVLVEYRGEDFNVPIRPEHKMTVKQVRTELEPEGFVFQKSLEFLPWQHIIVFTSP